MKRFLWTIFLALGGFWFAWIGQGKRSDLILLPIFTVWGGCIGFGLGSIFDHRVATRYLIPCWSVTSGLAVLVLFPLMPSDKVFVQLATAFAAGAIAGAFIGIVQVRFLTRKPRTASAGQLGRAP